VGRGFPLPTRGWVWEWAVPLPENFSILDLKMVSFDAFCVVFTVYNLQKLKFNRRLEVASALTAVSL